MKYILFVLLFVVNTVRSQCVLDNNERAHAVKSKTVENYNAFLSAGEVKVIDDIFSYLNRQYKKNIRYSYVNVKDAFYQRSTDSVFLGIPLFKELYESGGPSSVAFVICHEFSHYGQYLFPNNNGLVNGTSRISELQADLIGSYLMYNMFKEKVISYTGNDDDNTMKNIFDLGDNDFNDPDHHGSYIERFLTAELVEGTPLGQDMALGLSEIYDLANKMYTGKGIDVCGNLFGPFYDINGAGFLFDKNSGKYFIIALDFNIYPAFIIQAGKTVSIKDCIPEGNIDVTKSQHLNLKEQTLGFYIDIKVNGEIKKVYVFDKAVYTDETKKVAVPYLTWRKDIPVMQ